MGTLKGRIALVTGAGRGIGRAEARLLAAEGASVIVNDLGVAPDGSGGDTSVAREVADEINATGANAIANTDSVSDFSGAERMVNAAIEAFGDLHIVVNNAAVSRPRSLVNMTEEQFDDVMAVKAKGTFAVSHWAAQHWRARYDAGDRVDRSIINTSSASGLDSLYPLNTNYAAANAAVAAMTVIHSLELHRYNVRVNCLSPGSRTRLSANLPGGLQSQTRQTEDFDRWDPAHQAVVVAHLARPDCRLSGQVLTVRGSSVIQTNGWTLGAKIDNGDDHWSIDGLAAAMKQLPADDPFSRIEHLLTAYGIGGIEQMNALMDKADQQS